MVIDITCPVTKEPICEYTYQDIRKVVRDHMAEFHTDWYHVTGMEYLPYGAVQCPICSQPFEKAIGLDRHVQRTHKDYKKVDVLLYELRNDED